MSRNLPNEFERLANQDPAAGMQFDESALLDNLAGRLPQGTLEEAFPQYREDALAKAAHVAEHSKVTTLRPRNLAWTQIAASAAVTALAVGGGVALLNGDHTSQPLAYEELSTTHNPGVRVEGPGVDSMGSTTTSSVISPESSVSSTNMFFGSGRNIFSANGLSTEGAQSNVYGFDSTEALTKESFESLKSALGVTAETRSSWGTFYAGGEDGQGPTLSLQAGSDAAFSYSFNSELPESQESSEEEAVAQAQALMDGLGFDSESYTFATRDGEYYPWVGAQNVPGDGATIEPFEEDANTTHELEPEIDSRSLSVENSAVKSRVVTATLTQFGPEVWSVQWQFEFVGDTLVGVTGALADLVDLGRYDVISPAQGLERLNSSAFGALNVYYPEDGYGIMPAGPDTSISYTEDSAPQGVAAPQSGSAVTWQLSKVDLKDPTLAFATLYSGEFLQVVPVWRFTSTEGVSYEVLALTDEELALVP